MHSDGFILSEKVLRLRQIPMLGAILCLLCFQIHPAPGRTRFGRGQGYSDDGKQRAATHQVQISNHLMLCFYPFVCRHDPYSCAISCLPRFFFLLALSSFFCFLLLPLCCWSLQPPTSENSRSVVQSGQGSSVLHRSGRNFVRKVLHHHLLSAHRRN